MNFNDIKAIVADEVVITERWLNEKLATNVPLIQQIAEHIIQGGGKRIRPILTLLTAKALNYQGEAHLLTAVILEYVHTATLLHDDVVDNSTLRRGKPTANNVWDNTASVLAGDFLYSRAFELMVEINNMQVMGILAKATNVIAEGEMLQLGNCFRPETTEQEYLQVIQGKTAQFFEAASQIPAVLTQASPEVTAQLARFGMLIGTAFQLIDDVLDYTGNSDTIGKNAGDDLAEGKPTLPLIYAMKNSDAKARELIANTIKKGDATQLTEVLKIITECGALDYTKDIARQYIHDAKHCLYVLPTSEAKSGLNALAELVIARLS